MMLKEWIIKYKIKRIAVSDLLKILRLCGMCFSPSDSKTFIKTPKHVDIMPSTNGNMWYYGIDKNVRNLFPDIQNDIILSMNFNIDGLPLVNSNIAQFWPICANIHSMFSIN